MGTLLKKTFNYNLTLKYESKEIKTQRHERNKNFHFETSIDVINVF